MKLHDYMKTENIAPKDFAETLGVSAEAVRMWIRGDRTPRPKVMGDIVAATDGRVQPNDFYNEATA